MAITVEDIISFFPPVKFIGDKNATINRVVQLDTENRAKDILCWCNAKNIKKLHALQAGTVIVPTDALAAIDLSACNYIAVDNPRSYFNDVLTRFFSVQEPECSTSKLAVISPSAKIGSNALIGAQVMIKENCIIGNNVRILNNTIIHAGTVIHDGVRIGYNNIIGDHGFGYEMNKDGNHRLMPHIGNVVLGAEVEIGNNNCIDRAVLGSTTIASQTKIHSFVQIAHGVEIGSNCLVTANVTVSGSTKIGKNVWIGPGATIANKLKIGDSAYLSIGCVVLSDVPEGAIIIGNPGRILKSNPL
jgi:UDP-3-O-[3-hydroxymyristoyl] glucosamine N-acyltransferase